MDKKEIVKLIQDGMNGLVESGILEKVVIVDSDTILMGEDTVLDSIAFVTLFMDLEERLNEITGEEIYLLVDEIHEFNPEKTFLTAGVLSAYIEKLLEK